MATTLKDGAGTLMKEIAEHLATWGPILAIFGIMESREGAGGKKEFVPSEKFTTKAKAKMFGIGTDDESMVGAILGQLDKQAEGTSPTSPTGRNVLILWLSGLEKFQRDRFRLVLVGMISEFSEGDGKKHQSKGFGYAVDFLRTLASLPDDKSRTQLCLALNIISEKPPLAEQVWKKFGETVRDKGGASKTAKTASDVVANELRGANRALRTQLIGRKPKSWWKKRRKKSKKTTS